MNDFLVAAETGPYIQCSYLTLVITQEYIPRFTVFLDCCFGVPAWRLMDLYSITVSFSPILYCCPDVTTSRNPFETKKIFCPYSQCSQKVDAQKVYGCSKHINSLKFNLRVGCFWGCSGSQKT